MEPKFNASTKERNREVILVSALDDKDNPPVQGRRAKAKDDRWQLIKMHIKPLLLPDSLPRVRRYTVWCDYMSITHVLNSGHQHHSFGRAGVGKSSVVNLIAGK